VIAGARYVGFLASTDLDRSAEFFEGTLGLTVLDRSPFAVVVDAGGANLRVTLVQDKASAPYTVAGWEVADIETAVGDLRARGVQFLRFEGMQQDDHDAWLAPSGTRVAWFADPDSNTLSLEQHPS
jgi:catechol 2,3-dioxygenase-like lactoylglutathione lyase family enzyme